MRDRAGGGRFRLAGSSTDVDAAGIGAAAGTGAEPVSGALLSGASDSVWRRSVVRVCAESAGLAASVGACAVVAGATAHGPEWAEASAARAGSTRTGRCRHRPDRPRPGAEPACAGASTAKAFSAASAVSSIGGTLALERAVSVRAVSMRPDSAGDASSPSSSSDDPSALPEPSMAPAWLPSSWRRRRRPPRRPRRRRWPPSVSFVASLAGALASAAIVASMSARRRIGSGLRSACLRPSRPGRPDFSAGTRGACGDTAWAAVAVVATAAITAFSAFSPCGWRSPRGCCWRRPFSPPCAAWS